MVKILKGELVEETRYEEGSVSHFHMKSRNIFKMMKVTEGKALEVDKMRMRIMRDEVKLMVIILLMKSF